ncbi:transposase [Thiocapsa sp. KS1]|nr:IS4 family transposase [Thiocapsa sp. KS1]CRI67066.1 transposase [Thiocapsa sp. KS1]
MHPNQPAAQRQRVLAHIADTDVGGFFDLLTAAQLLERVEALQPPFRERVYSPTETLAMFMTQALSEDGSCRAVVNAAAVRRVLDGEAPLATNTSAYCQARARLSLPMIATLAREAAGLVTKAAPGWWLWQGRAVRLVDGATVTLADTPQNQAKYPQPASQKAGPGFPIARLVALVCLATGAVLDAALGPCAGKGGDEQTLLRELLDSLQSGEILLGDAFYATYFLLCELVRGGVDGLFEQHGARKRSTDFRLGERLGARDHLIVPSKPKTRPDWMSPEEYAQAPATLRVREFQAGGKIMVTTLLCPKVSPKSMLKVLYRQRWHVELDLRNLKTTLGMEHLRCKTPAMALKELWVYLLAYTLIRLLMAQAALVADQIPRQLSFKHVVQMWGCVLQCGGTGDSVCIHALLVLMAQPRVGRRAGRIEPRALKRRLKSYPLLTKPRKIAQEEVREHGHPKKQR